MADRVDYTSLEDAYGPAAGIPDRLRALTDEAGVAEEALEELAAGIFHQGSYFSATAPATRELVEIVAAEVPARAAILRLLAEMSGGVDLPRLAWNPTFFHATPAVPTYPAAVATIAEIRAGCATYAGALGSPDPRVRAAAAWLLARLDARDLAPALTAALAGEGDELVRCTFVLASLRLGVAVAARAVGVEGDLATALGGAARPQALTALERLARQERVDRRRLPFAAGDLAAIGVQGLERLAVVDKSAVAAALWRVLHARLDRGERIAPPLPPPRALHVDQDEADVDRAPTDLDHELDRDAGLRAAAGALARLLVPVAAEGAFLGREALDDAAREVLRLTVEHEIPLPVPGLPWITSATMTRFLAGDGPLDRVITISGRTAPLWEHLHRLPRPEDPARADHLRALAGQLSDGELFDVVVDALSGAYPCSGIPMGWLVIRELAAPRADRLLRHPERFARYRDTLSGDICAREEAWFALLPERTARAPADPRFDLLVSCALAVEPAEQHEWLRAFDEPRRSRLLARTGNPWICSELAAECDAGALGDALVEAFVAPTCRWLAFEAEQMLVRVGVDALRAATPRVTGSKAKAKVLARAIAELTRAGFFRLDLSATATGIEAKLARHGGEPVAARRLPAVPLPADLTWIRDALAAEPRPIVVETASQLDATIAYQIFLHLGRLLDAELRTGGQATS